MKIVNFHKSKSWSEWMANEAWVVKNLRDLSQNHNNGIGRRWRRQRCQLRAYTLHLGRCSKERIKKQSVEKERKGISAIIITLMRTFFSSWKYVWEWKFCCVCICVWSDARASYTYNFSMEKYTRIQNIVWYRQ